MLGRFQVFNLVESCKESVRRIARYLIELGVVRRMLGENTRYLIELRAVRRLLLEDSEVFDRVEL